VAKQISWGDRPSAGPRYGAAEKTANATPRSLLSNTSEIVPPALVKGDEPKLPLKKRRMITVQMFIEPTRPALKAVNMA
jgi:hypothetical protein